MRSARLTLGAATAPALLLGLALAAPAQAAAPTRYSSMQAEASYYDDGTGRSTFVSFNADYLEIMDTQITCTSEEAVQTCDYVSRTIQESLAAGTVTFSRDGRVATLAATQIAYQEARYTCTTDESGEYPEESCSESTVTPGSATFSARLVADDAPQSTTTPYRFSDEGEQYSGVYSHRDYFVSAPQIDAFGETLDNDDLEYARIASDRVISRG